MPHPLVEQLRFTRSELQRALHGVTDEEARRRFEPMNCISWIIGHLASQEQHLWLYRAQGIILAPELEAVGYGAPASTPPLDAMWTAWHTVTQAANQWLDTLTTSALQAYFLVDGKPWREDIGTFIRRTTYHYWYHIGESQAIRQLLGHTDLPVFVGNLQASGPYRPE